MASTNKFTGLEWAKSDGSNSDVVRYLQKITMIQERKKKLKLL